MIVRTCLDAGGTIGCHRASPGPIGDHMSVSVTTQRWREGRWVGLKHIAAEAVAGC